MKKTLAILAIVILFFTTIMFACLSAYLFVKLRNKSAPSKCPTEVEETADTAESSDEETTTDDDKDTDETDTESTSKNCMNKSTDGQFYVTLPCTNDALESTFSIRGRGIVNEALFSVRIKDSSGTVLYNGNHMTEGGYKPELDAFSDTITWTPPSSSGTGTIEFYTISLMDGSEESLVKFAIKY